MLKAITTLAALLTLTACDPAPPTAEQSRAAEILAETFPDDPADLWDVDDTWVLGDCTQWGERHCEGYALASHPTVWGGEWADFQLYVRGETVVVWVVLDGEMVRILDNIDE